MEKLKIENANTGVQIARASKEIMSKSDKIVIFTGLLLVSWAMTWEKDVVNAVTSTVTSDFGANNVSAVLTTVLNILQTALQPIYSKVSDMTGRAGAYTAAIVFFIVSFVIMAVSQNYNALIGGQAVYAFGYSGTYILGYILIGDMTSFVNRGLYLALYNLPNIINLFVASVAAQSFLDKGEWRWAYGHVTILMFATSAPIIFGLWRIHFKAKKLGLVEKHQHNDESLSFIQKLKWIAIQVDLMGSLLLVGGLFLILLPIILATTWGGWGNVKVIATLVAGGVAWILFGLWEWKFAQKPIVPITNWESKNPIWGVLTIATVKIINSLMDLQYFLTYLQVTRRVTPRVATYLERGFNCAYVCLPVLIGYCMTKTHNWRPYVWAGSGLCVLATGLMIPARHSTFSDAFIVIVQVLFGSADALMHYPMMVAVQASVPPEDVAIVITLFEIGVSVSMSIGSAISGAIWNAALPGLFEKYVPGDYTYLKIVQSISYAKALPEEQYEGVVHAYDDAMRIFGIVSVCIAALGFLFSLPLKGFKLKDDTSSNSSTAETIKEMDIKQ